MNSVGQEMRIQSKADAVCAILSVGLETMSFKVDGFVGLTILVQEDQVGGLYQHGL